MNYRLFIFKTLLTFVSLAILCQVSMAQDYTDDWKFLRKGEIISNDDLVGYYEFYRIRSEADHCTDYALRILDPFLHTEIEKKINLCGGYFLNEASKIGDSYLFKFYASGNKFTLYMFCDSSGNIVNKVERRETDCIEFYMDREVQSMFDYNLPSLHNLGDDFVVDCYTKFVKRPFRTDYEIVAINSRGENAWVYESNSKDVANRKVEYIGNDSSQVVVQEVAYEKLISTKAKVSLIAIDTTGETIFKIDMNSSKKNLMARSCFMSSKGNWNVFGYYFNGNGKMLRDAPIGLFYLEINQNGEILSEVLTPWINVLDETGKSINYRPYIQDFIRLDSNKCLIITENIKSTGSINISGAKHVKRRIQFVNNGEYQRGGASLEYDDLLLILMDSEGKVIKTKSVDKLRKRLTLPNGWGLSNRNIIVSSLAQQHYFDYQFSQTSLDDSKIFIYYKDMDENNDYKYIKKILVLDNDLNEITTDEIVEESTDNKGIFTFPGYKGYVRLEIMKGGNLEQGKENFDNHVIEPINY
jgi:hypothetical protein